MLVPWSLPLISLLFLAISSFGHCNLYQVHGAVDDSRFYPLRRICDGLSLVLCFFLWLFYQYNEMSFKESQYILWIRLCITCVLHAPPWVVSCGSPSFVRVVRAFLGTLRLFWHPQRLYQCCNFLSKMFCYGPGCF